MAEDNSKSQDLDENSKLDAINRKLDHIININNSHNLIESRAKILYSQKCYNGIPVLPQEQDELVDAFVKMETALIQNDILSYALFAYKQSETILSSFINNFTQQSISNDLLESNGPNGEILMHRVFSLHNVAVNGTNYDKIAIDDYTQNGVIPALFDKSYMNKLRYFIWYFDFKLSIDVKTNLSRKNNKFFFTEKPYQYLRAARNRIHGGKINNVNKNDLTRVQEIESNKAKFFLVFSSLLHDLHKRFYQYNNL